MSSIAISRGASVSAGSSRALSAGEAGAGEAEERESKPDVAPALRPRTPGG